MVWTYIDNGDGTVTLDKKVYEELRCKANEYQKLIDAVFNALNLKELECRK